jgi:DNA-binding SARP family transcriptional activator
MLKIHLFGSGCASYHDKKIAGFPSHQPCLLFCYLLLNRQSLHRREHLASIFWGDQPNQLARKSLRNTLWRLRNSFNTVGIVVEDYLTINEDTVTFINSSSYWLDIAIFEDCINRYQEIPPRSLSKDQVLQLEEAANLYTGDLLESVYQDWCLYDRERLRIMLLNLLNKIMVYHGLTGNYESGIECGKRILSFDSTREKIHRQLMWLYMLAGDRTASIAQYKQCCQVLLDELGISPMEETKSLFELIVNNPAQIKNWSDQGRINLPSVSDDLEQFQSQPLLEHTINKLHRLQKMIEETGDELQLLENLISRVFTSSK